MVAVVLAIGAASTAWALPRVDRAATATQVARRGAAEMIGDAPRPTTTPYGLPVALADGAGWHSTHSTYPATDVFAACGVAT